MIREKRAATTDITHKFVPGLSGLAVLLRAQSVHFRVTESDEHLVIPRRIQIQNLFERNQGEVAKRGAAAQVLLIDGERDYLVFTVAGKIYRSKTGNIARPKDY
jgi:hypothetical protein